MSSYRRKMASACKKMHFGNVHQKPRLQILQIVRFRIASFVSYVLVHLNLYLTTLNRNTHPHNLLTLIF